MCWVHTHAHTHTHTHTHTQCGADYVKTGQTLPQGVEFRVGDRCASFDGDADRIVYFFRNTSGYGLNYGYFPVCVCVSLRATCTCTCIFPSSPDDQFQLLDGDRVAALASLFIHEQLQQLPFSLSFGEYVQYSLPGISRGGMLECRLTLSFVHSPAQG